APVMEPTSGSVPGSGASAAGAAWRLGRSLSAARRSKAGMTTAAITGTYVLHEHTFSCQVRLISVPRYGSIVDDMRVGEVAERAGVNVETLRYYERRGLLPAPARAPGGHRRYDEETVRFLGAIKEAQAVGFTLAEIADYLRAARRSSAPSEALRVRMAAKIDQIDGRIAALQRMREELARVVGCACVSL